MSRNALKRRFSFIFKFPANRDARIIPGLSYYTRHLLFNGGFNERTHAVFFYALRISNYWKERIDFIKQTTFLFAGALFSAFPDRDDLKIEKKKIIIAEIFGRLILPGAARQHEKPFRLFDDGGVDHFSIQSKSAFSLCLIDCK